jgi:hypothetical protein
MPTPAILVATWGNGVFHVTGNAVQRELEGRSVRSLTGDGRGGVLAVVDGNSLHRRSADGQWSELVSSEFKLSCCVAAANAVFMGTDDARLVRVDADGTQQILSGFDGVEGREKWYAGQAIVDGQVMGPPLGIRSMTATPDGGALLANVHVGGVPRSTDLGRTWRPTIDVEADVHQVCAHPTRARLVIAAAAVGLCISRDAGQTWEIDQRGLHASHCSGVAFGKNDIYVSASVDPFSAQGALYRRPIDGDVPLQLVGHGFPPWTEGKADTDCIAARDSAVAVIDMSGRLYVSQDDGAKWTVIDDRLPDPSGLFIC